MCLTFVHAIQSTVLSDNFTWNMKYWIVIKLGAGPNRYQIDAVFPLSDFSSSVHVLQVCLRETSLNSLIEDMYNRCTSGFLGKHRAYLYWKVCSYACLLLHSPGCSGLWCAYILWPWNWPQVCIGHFPVAMIKHNDMKSFTEESFF